MKKIDLDIEAVTAVFNHVTPDGGAVWRAAPFRGAARWWVRALLGGSGDEGAVRERESAIFGTAEEPSKIVVRVFPNGTLNKKYDVNPGSNKSAQKDALPQGSRARLSLSVSPYGGGLETLSEAYGSMWLALHLGGIGGRSRRGAGSLRVLSCSPPGASPQPITATTADRYARDLEAGIAEIRRAFRLEGYRLQQAGFPVLHPNHCRIVVAQTRWTGDETAVRRSLMTQRRNVSSHLNRAPEPQFGSIKPRLSSPLIVRVAAIDKNGAIIVMSLFRHAGAALGGTQPNWKAADELIDSIGEVRHEVALK